MRSCQSAAATHALRTSLTPRFVRTLRGKRTSNINIIQLEYWPVFVSYAVSSYSDNRLAFKNRCPVFVCMKQPKRISLILASRSLPMLSLPRSLARCNKRVGASVCRTLGAIRCIERRSCRKRRRIEYKLFAFKLSIDQSNGDCVIINYAPSNAKPCIW